MPLQLLRALSSSPLLFPPRSLVSSRQNSSLPREKEERQRQSNNSCATEHNYGEWMTVQYNKWKKKKAPVNSPEPRQGPVERAGQNKKNPIGQKSSVGTNRNQEVRGAAEAADGNGNEAMEFQASPNNILNAGGTGDTSVVRPQSDVVVEAGGARRQSSTRSREEREQEDDSLITVGPLEHSALVLFQKKDEKLEEAANHDAKLRRIHSAQVGATSPNTLKHLSQPNVNGNSGDERSAKTSVFTDISRRWESTTAGEFSGGSTRGRGRGRGPSPKERSDTFANASASSRALQKGI